MRLPRTNLIPRTWPTITFLGISLLETIVDVAIVAVLLHSFESSFIDTVLARNENSVLPVYLGLFILAHIFQFVLTLDAIVAKNTLQVVGLLLFNTLFLAYALAQISEIRSLIEGKVLRVLVWCLPGMIALTEIVYLVTFWPIYREFGWQIYKRIGADRRLKRYYMWYQVFLCLLKFDVFFFVAFSLQLVLLALDQAAVERWLTVAAIPGTTLILFIGYLSVRKESRVLFYTFFAGILVGAAYFIFRLFRIYQFRESDYVLVYKSLTLFAALCFVALIGTGLTALICSRHFNRGLAQAINKIDDTDLSKHGDGNIMLQSANNSRMSID